MKTIKPINKNGYPVVSYILPYAIFLPLEEYDVKFQNDIYKVKLRFIPNLQSALDKPMASTGQWELLHDAQGRTGKSIFYIKFPYKIEVPSLNVDKNPGDEISKEDWRELDNQISVEDNYILSAISIGNRLIEVYKDQDMNCKGEYSFHVFYVNDHSILNPHFFIIDDSDKTMYTSSERPIYGNTMSNSTGGRNQIIVDNVRRILTTEEQIPIWRKLIRSSQNYLWQGDYRLSVIEANTAFEIVINEKLRNYNPARLNLGLIDKMSYLQKYINDERIKKNKNILTWTKDFQENTWADVYNNPRARREIIEWRNYCYKFRNDGAHQGISPTKQKALDALKYTEKAINFIQNIENI